MNQEGGITRGKKFLGNDFPPPPHTHTFHVKVNLPGPGILARGKHSLLVCDSLPPSLSRDL